MIKTKGLQYSYENGKRFEFPNINLAKNENLLIHGNSGVGKTTLLNLLGMLIKPTSGDIFIDDINGKSISDAKLPGFRAKHVGVIYQKSYFVQALSVLDNLLLASYFGNKTKNIKLAKSLASELGFFELLSKKTMALSGGEQQRVSIARALMNTPSIVLADEPTSALDDENTEIVFSLLENQSKANNATLIIVSHDQRLKSNIKNQMSLK
jgi:lipoprotein-releasing system ATP-binding protein